jgi:hypothetical protein
LSLLPASLCSDKYLLLRGALFFRLEEPKPTERAPLSTTQVAVVSQAQEAIGDPKQAWLLEGELTGESNRPFPLPFSTEQPILLTITCDDCSMMAQQFSAQLDDLFKIDNGLDSIVQDVEQKWAEPPVIVFATHPC